MSPEENREFFAHSENKKGKRQELGEHLLRTAELAKSFSPSRDFEHLFYFTGLLHDVGKFQMGFQRYLFNGGKRTPHAGIGAHIAHVVAKELIPTAFAINGHHAGLADKIDLKTTLDEYALEKDTINELIEKFRDRIPESKAMEDGTDNGGLTDRLTLEFLTRLLFSALTDADWLDTERHFEEERADLRESQRLDQDKLCERLLAKLERKFNQFPIEGTINRLRTEARTDAMTLAEEEPGFFSLQLPTGLGKTLTSVYWALMHAKHNQLKRIIIVLPYINIIDQTANTLRDVFGEDIVLEHHSGITDDDKRYSEEDCQRNADSMKRLACENWDAAIIVTTSVQFFESLFSNRPFKCRKNHNISESVVIFDEIQTLSKHLAEPTIVMLKNFAALARSTFLFCTATLPAFDKREGFDGIETIRPLIKRPRQYFDATRRVEYQMLNKLKPMTIDFVEKKLSREKKSFLVIVNTKSLAKDLFRRVSNFAKYDGYYHLSTGMCPHHRKETISKIIRDLSAKRRIAVVSTQLVEAGVDFDFPCVYRAMAPLDAIIQSAGRCNRNGEPSGEKGKVVLFNLEHQKMPDKTYKACAELTEVMVKEDLEFLYRIDSFEKYYRAVSELLVDTDTYNITEERRNFNFKTVNQQYQIIEAPTTPLFVADYSEESKALLNEVTRGLEFGGFITRDEYRKLQQYSVQVYPDFLRKHAGQIELVKDTLRIWHGRYDEKIGLAPEDIETVF